MDIHELKRQMNDMAQSTAKAKADPDKLLSTGSTLLNLACSGHWQGGWLHGSYIYLVGDSKSGKTFFGLTCFAEACLNPFYKNHRLIYDAVERGAKMDFAKFFGPTMAARWEPPNRLENGEPDYSFYIEEFYFNIDTLLKSDQPFIYLLDSMDGLDSLYGEKKFAEAKKAHAKKTKAKGDFGDGKAKVNSRNIRRVAQQVADHGSILIIISQTRDNVDAGMFESKKTRSGGHALRFYADTEIWTSVGSAIKVEYKVPGKDKKHPVQIGGNIRATVKKNRLNGRERSVTVPIFYDHGFDDVGGCVDYMTEWGGWKKAGGGYIEATLDSGEWTYKLQREALIQQIIEDGMESELAEAVGETWHAVEAAVAVERKGRYV